MTYFLEVSQPNSCIRFSSFLCEIAPPISYPSSTWRQIQIMKLITQFHSASHVCASHLGTDNYHYRPPVLQHPQPLFSHRSKTAAAKACT